MKKSSFLKLAPALALTSMFTACSDAPPPPKKPSRAGLAGVAIIATAAIMDSQEEKLDSAPPVFEIRNETIGERMERQLARNAESHINAEPHPHILGNPTLGRRKLYAQPPADTPAEVPAQNNE